jgi:hypothetical protein
MSLGLVAREYPYGETTGKRSIYRLEDNMFRFWYRFVFPNQSAITSGLGNAVFENIVLQQLNAYMGLVFENICKQWFFVQAKKEPNDNAPPFFVGSIGRWWGTNPTTRKQEEIDIMAAHGDNALFAECKWTNADVDIDVYHDLKRKSTLFQYNSSYLYIFTKNFVSSKVYEEYARGHVKIYPLDELIQSIYSSK